MGQKGKMRVSDVKLLADKGYELIPS